MYGDPTNKELKKHREYNIHIWFLNQGICKLVPCINMFPSQQDSPIPLNAKTNDICLEFKDYKTLDRI